MDPSCPKRSVQGTRSCAPKQDALPGPAEIVGKMPGVVNVKVLGRCGCPGCAAAGRGAVGRVAGFKHKAGRDVLAGTLDRTHRGRPRSQAKSKHRITATQVDLCVGKQPITGELILLHRVPCRGKKAWHRGLCGLPLACLAVGSSGAVSKGVQREPNPPELTLAFPVRSFPGSAGTRAWGQGCRTIAAGHGGTGSVRGVPHPFPVPPAPPGEGLPGAFSPLAGDVAWSWGHRTRSSLCPQAPRAERARAMVGQGKQGVPLQPPSLPPCHPFGRASKDVTFSLPFCQLPPSRPAQPMLVLLRSVPL